MKGLMITLLILFLAVPLVSHGQLESLVDVAKSGGFSFGPPFGGSIVLVRPCYNFSAVQVIVGPPIPGSYIYQTGFSRSYLNGPPFRPGQWLLGMVGGIGICDIDIDPKNFDGQQGKLIRFHGSSL